MYAQSPPATALLTIKVCLLFTCFRFQPADIGTEQPFKRDAAIQSWRAAHYSKPATLMDYLAPLTTDRLCMPAAAHLY